jgi:hypothetical protein
VNGTKVNDARMWCVACDAQIEVREWEPNTPGTVLHDVALEDLTWATGYSIVGAIATLIWLLTPTGQR